jgi:hypothetical protein
MDLLSSSCRSISVAAARKAIKIWAAWRSFWKVNNGQFGVVHVRIQPTGQIRQFCQSHTGPINVVDERVQGYWLGGSVGGIICLQPKVLIGTMVFFQQDDVRTCMQNNS